MYCVNNINNHVIIWLIIQKQHLQAALLSNHHTLTSRAKTELAWFTVVTQLIHTHKHTLTHTHTRYWTSVSLLSKGNMSALSSRSKVSSPR